MTSTDFTDLTAQVQRNCHISDALHARNYSLCIYLLKMREYFRWEKGYGYAERLPERELGAWLTERERYWEELEEQEYQPINLHAYDYQPFEPAALNDTLLAEGLVYSGGYGGLSKPHFFLARLQSVKQLNGSRILITDEEYARDLTAPAALSLDGEIYIRRDALRRMLWEKIEEWNWKQQDNAMARALAFYPLEGRLDAALDDMTSVETDVLVQHELGELAAGTLLGDGWEQMLNASWHTRAELIARAVRDHLADCLVTLPMLLEEQRIPSLHLYLANLDGMRQALFPSLQSAYQQWCDGGSLDAIKALVQRGQTHWLTVAKRLLHAYGDEDNAAAERIEQAAEGIEL